MSSGEHVDLATADGHDRYVPSETRDIVSAGHEGVYEWVAEHLVSEGTRFLDLGCGTGYGSTVVTAAGGTFDGADSSPAAIEYAQAKYSAPNVRFFCADLMEPLPPAFSPGSYDVVFSSEVLEHVVDPFAFVRTMASLVRDDGGCFLGTPNRLWSLGNMPNGALMARSHVMEFTPSALVALLHTAFDDVTLLFRMFPGGAMQSTLSATDRPRLVRGAVAFVREVAPGPFSRCRNVLGRRKVGRKWLPRDIVWVGPEDLELDMSRCVGLAAVCRSPKR